MNEFKVLQQALSDTLPSELFQVIFDYAYYDFRKLSLIVAKFPSSHFFSEKLKRVLLYLGAPQQIKIGVDTTEMMCVLFYNEMTYPKGTTHKEDTVVVITFKDHMVTRIRTSFSKITVEVRGPMKISGTISTKEYALEYLEFRNCFKDARLKHCETPLRPLKKSVKQLLQ